MLSQLKGGGAVRHVFGPKNYSIRHTYSESASNSEYYGYLGIFNFEKKNFWSLTPFPGGLRGSQVKKLLFEIKQKNHLTVCIRLC